MTLITRIGRLLRADIHGLLDSLEEPAAIVRQSIREMEEELKSLSDARDAAERQLDDIRRRREELKRRSADIEQKLDVCFDEASDELARSLVRRKLENERSSGLLKTREEMFSAAVADKNRRLEEGRERLRAVREKYEVLSAGEQRASQHGGEDPLSDGPIGDAEVEAAFIAERMKRKTAAAAS